MLGRTTGAVLVGVEARLIEVEVDLAGGLPTIAAVGLPDPAVREGIDRIRSALRNAGFRLPQKRVVVNLAPADVRKHGAALDLPIAVAVLLADGRIEGLDSSSMVMAGEIALDGALRPVRGALSIAMAARAAGRRRLLLPPVNADEAALVPDLEVLPVSTLADIVAVSRGAGAGARNVDARSILSRAARAAAGPDLADVCGQATARRVLEIAAAGGHHLLLSGPPGAGKTMLARRLPGVLPPLALSDALSVTRVWSAAGLRHGLVAERPFRAPHHGISLAGMTGGGPWLKPGEVTLSSHGVLYLDELTEFRRDALEALRQPLEDGRIVVTRVHATATFPAEFTLVASMNPCRCGWYGSPDNRCECTPREIVRYRSRLSGPLLDRFDLVLQVPAVDLESLATRQQGEASAVVRERVAATRERQRRRFGESGSSCNARMAPRELDRHAPLAPAVRRFLVRAGNRFGITARGYDRVRRVALTLADMEGCASIEQHHVAEALQYRHAAPED